MKLNYGERNLPEQYQQFTPLTICDTKFIFTKVVLIVVWFGSITYKGMVLF